jgi:5-methylcytosine-specific restriction endonuclease McrA
MSSSVIQSRAWRQLRLTLKQIWQPRNSPCALCGQATIDWDAPANDADSFEPDHRISRKRALAMGKPELLLDPNNCQPAHMRCNRAKGAGDGPMVLGETSEEF